MESAAPLIASQPSALKYTVGRPPIGSLMPRHLAQPLAPVFAHALAQASVHSGHSHHRPEVYHDPAVLARVARTRDFCGVCQRNTPVSSCDIYIPIWKHLSRSCWTISRHPAWKTNIPQHTPVKQIHITTAPGPLAFLLAIEQQLLLPKSHPISI